MTGTHIKINTGNEHSGEADFVSDLSQADERSLKNWLINKYGIPCVVTYTQWTGTEPPAGAFADIAAFEASRS